MGWDLFAYRICFISGVVYATIAALIGGLLGFGRMVVSRQAGGFERAAQARASQA